jgi:hypothetical protein
MSNNSQYFDLAIIETENGGDLQLLGKDLAVVYGNENQMYLAMFGGNVEQDTEAVVTLAESDDFWANSLLFPSDAFLQFNSKVERLLNTTELSSSGRVVIENGVKGDLKFLKSLGAEITVSVTIPATNIVTIQINAVFKNGQKSVTIINYKKKANGDFSALDFNNDFFI